MSRLSKDEKLDKRWEEYAEYVDKKDMQIYSMHEDERGFWHFAVNGFPAPQEFTRKYNGAKRKVRRNKRGVR